MGGEETTGRRCLMGWVVGLAIAWLPSFLRVSKVALSGVSHGLAERNPLPIAFHALLALLPYDLARSLLITTILGTVLYWLAALFIGTLMQLAYKSVCGHSRLSSGALAAVAWSAVIGVSPLAYLIPRLLGPEDSMLTAAVAYRLLDSLFVFALAFMVLGVAANLTSSLLLSWTRVKPSNA